MKTFFKWLLISVPISVAVWQLYQSNFSNLTRWKGGGFGMYTDIHINHRCIWIEITRADTVIELKIHPVETPWAPKDPMVGAIRKTLGIQLDNLVSFPSSVNFSGKEMAQVKALLLEKKSSKLKMVVGQLAVEIDSGFVENKILFQHEF